MLAWEVLKSNRDEGARILIAEYGARLYATAFRICQNEADAEDLVQRTLVRVVERIDSFSGKSSFFTWMCSILVNFRRMDLRRKGMNALVFPETVPDCEDARPDPGTALDTTIEAAALRAAVDNLPETLRTTVVLHYFDDLSVPEIARALDVPEGTVYYRLHDARQRIREKLAKVLKNDCI